MPIFTEGCPETALLKQIPRTRLLWLNNTHLIDPVAFGAALILGPIIFTALTFYFIVPVFALVFGAIPYLTIGVYFF